MRFTTKVTSLVAAGGAAALGIGLLAFAPGVGAAFTDSAHANATIEVGTLDCTIGSTATDANVNGNTVTVPLGLIADSGPGNKTAPVTVTNDGNIPLNVSWNVSTKGKFFSSAWQHTYVPVDQNQVIAVGHSHTYTIGAQWSNELTNSDMGHAGLVTYTANCSDQPAALWFSDDAGGEHSWANNSSLNLTVPSAATSPFAGVSAHIIGAVGQHLTSSQKPGFTASPLPAVPGALRLSILLNDGSRVIVNSDGSVNNGGSETWEQAVNGKSGLTIEDAMLVADTSEPGGFTTDVTCLDLSGTPVFGSGC